MMMRCLLLTLIILIAIAPIDVVPFDEPLTADEIIHKALARADTQYQSLIDAAFESEVISETRSLDGDLNVTKTESNKRRQYGLNGALFEEIVEKNGKSLTDKERRQEQKKKEEFIREVKKRVSRGDHPQPEKDPGIRFNQDFVRRYRLTRAGTEMVREHRCWIIAFEPKAGDLPVQNRMDVALNHSTGKFWISQDDYGLARIEFALRKPFKYWGGFLAVIRNTDGRLDYKRVEPNIWMPMNFDLKLDLEVLMVKDIRRHITIKWSGYRRARRGAITQQQTPGKA